ncbi:MAG: transposase [Gammaproteobacteria bacterium]|jgi:REP element-mobilizing transposase RayT|nr:transposase [Gammaproteobacteria bacterium]MBQ0773159.1 transposase [Gammaproteobacteria bacterium]
MTRARRQQVSVESTPYYHCINRCVRRAFLCGTDRYSGKNFDHRRAWMVERLAQLTQVFAIDLCAYALMSNHYHLVLRIDTETLDALTDHDVALRWTALFSGHALVQRYMAGVPMDDAEKAAASDMLQEYRARLGDISWFMRCLNEYVARKANEEDGCKGRFWEGRFKSQALLDEKALLACMAYVDLNPVRAGMAETPESSAYTSIQQRSFELSDKDKLSDAPRPTLLPLVSKENTEAPWRDTLCQVRVMDYLELVDWTGRALRQDKRHAIAQSCAPILDRLGISESDWLKHMKPRPNRLLQAVGPIKALQDYAQAIGKKWLCDQRRASVVYG